MFLCFGSANGWLSLALPVLPPKQLERYWAWTRRRLRYFGSGWNKHTKTHSQRNMRRLVVWWVAHSASKPFHFALSVLNAGGAFPFVRISICSRKSCKAFSANLSICSNFHLFASVLYLAENHKRGVFSYVMDHRSTVIVHLDRTSGLSERW